MGELEFFAWDEDLLDGLVVTLMVTVGGFAAALVVAFVLGLVLRMHQVVPRTIARIVVEFFRGTSLLVQLFWLFYVLPLLGYQLVPAFAAIVAFALNFGAYGAEIVRGAINSVPRPQWEATVALSMGSIQRMRRVIFPQALPLMIPPFTNLLIQTMKSSPLVYLITVVDLFTVGTQYFDSVGNAGFIFGLLLVIFFVLSYLFTFLSHLLEARAAARLGRVTDRRKLFSYRGPTEEELS